MEPHSGRTLVATAIDQLITVLEEWDEVTSIGVNRSGDDRYDPYFHLSLDVYLRDSVRPPASRKAALGSVGAFESSLQLHKDRFFLGEIPVRIEYKRVSRFDQLVTAALAGENALRDNGTYPFRRIADAEVALSRGGWFERVRTSLESLPGEFWAQLRAAQEASAEHLYADLAASAMRDDPYFFLLSAGRFVGTFCSLLFAVNRTFEPSPRALAAEVLLLPDLPDSLPANLEHLVTPGHGHSLTQRAEIAELMITGALAL